MFFSIGKERKRESNNVANSFFSFFLFLTKITHRRLSTFPGAPL